MDARHEWSDVNIRAIAWFAAGLTIAGACIAVIVWGLFAYLASREAGTIAPDRPGLAADASVPPEPRLQTTPREDLRAFRAREDRTLMSYGWVDRDAGIVRIPIEEAMKLVVERGLPARTPVRGAR